MSIDKVQAVVDAAVHMTLDYAYMDEYIHASGPTFDMMYFRWYQCLNQCLQLWGPSRSHALHMRVQQAVDSWWLGGTGQATIDAVFRLHQAAVVEVLEGKKSLTQELRRALHESASSRCAFTTPDGLRRLDDILMYPRKVMEGKNYDALARRMRTPDHACAERIWLCIAALRTLRPMSHVSHVPPELLLKIAAHYLRLPSSTSPTFFEPN